MVRQLTKLRQYSEKRDDKRRKIMEMQIVHYPDPDSFDSDSTLGNKIFVYVIRVLFETNKDKAAKLSNAAKAAMTVFSNHCRTSGWALTE